MFKRKIEKELIRWKKSLAIKRTAFLLKGLRQVGKTFIIKHFAYEHYEHVVYINFKLEAHMKGAFGKNLSVDTLVTNISAMKPDAVFKPHKTVLILDEIQECSGARVSIKSFVENDDRYDVIASGSLLGIKGYNQHYNGGAPIGYEHTVYMKAMDFEEFLWATGISDETLDYLRDRFMHREEISEPVHEAMLRYFKEYLIVGGMPAVVDAYLKTHDMNFVRTTQRDILEGYKDDYGKHLDENENEVLDKALLARINRVFEVIPAQLAKENKKFAYAQLTHKATSAQYGPAIQWLVDYGLVNYCYNLSVLEPPLAGNKKPDCFKLYFCDTGLFVSLLDPETSGDILLGDLGQYKGAIYENIVADAFSKMGRDLYYYGVESRLEIDFITRCQKEIALIEVKARTGNAKSSKVVLSNKNSYPMVHRLIKLGEYQIHETVDAQGNHLMTMPYYLTFLLPE